MEVSEKAFQKARAKLKRSYLLKLCLKTKTCPLCAENLTITIDGNRNLNYTCMSCSFVWPQKSVNERTKSCLKEKIKQQPDFF